MKLQFENNEYYLMKYGVELAIATTDESFIKELGAERLFRKNCEAVANGYDLDEIVKQTKQTLEDSRISSYDSFKIGFQKALEILGDKKFSEGDMRKAYGIGFLQHGVKSFYSLIQSLQQTEWLVEVEMECVMGCQNLILNGENSVCCGDKKPKLDADGCLILKRK